MHSKKRELHIYITKSKVTAIDRTSRKRKGSLSFMAKLWCSHRTSRREGLPVAVSLEVFGESNVLVSELMRSALPPSPSATTESSSIVIKLSRPAQRIVRIGSVWRSGLHGGVHGGEIAIPRTLISFTKVVSTGRPFFEWEGDISHFVLPAVDLARLFAISRANLGDPAPSNSIAARTRLAGQRSCT